MGCCGGRNDKDDLINLRAEQKWDYINLQDFKSTSCWTPFSYIILYLSVIISIAVYGVDTFTAVNLLAFSRWASQIKPKIPFHISKWIFAGCIIFSFVLLIYRLFRAIRVIKSGAIAPCYLDPIALRVQSMRMGKRGQGWRRFLVFADLTKSKKGADYVALFAYFNFEAWLRILVAEAPRQAINGITLYSVLQLDLIPQGENAPKDGTSSFVQFFNNIEALAQQSTQQAAILFGMLFTFVIWAISLITLIISMILYLVFLWHHIPSEDGSLSKYCLRKINSRLEVIVKQRVDKALAKGIGLQDRKRTDLEGGFGPAKRQPTLPTFESPSQQSLPPFPGELSRQTTGTTLPPYSRSNTGGFQRQPTLPDMKWDDDRRGAGTPTNRFSDDNSPLVSNAGGMGYSDYAPSTAPSLPQIERSGTPLSLRTGPPPSLDRRTPGPQGRSGDGYGPGNGYPMPGPPPSAAGRSTPVPHRTGTPTNGYPPSRTPQPQGQYRPNPSSTPAPSQQYRNFTRPYLNDQPQRAATGTPRAQGQPPFNQF